MCITWSCFQSLFRVVYPWFSWQNWHAQRTQNLQKNFTVKINWYTVLWGNFIDRYLFPALPIESLGPTEGYDALIHLKVVSPPNPPLKDNGNLWGELRPHSDLGSKTTWRHTKVTMPTPRPRLVLNNLTYIFNSVRDSVIQCLQRCDLILTFQISVLHPPLFLL